MGPNSLRVGRFELHLLSDGFFRLDGGAMYGVVPKSLWCRAEPETDERNRVLLDLGCLLIVTPQGRRVLVDTGLSSKYDADKRFRGIYAVDRSRTLHDGLKELGLTAADIDLVVNTHLHFDHAGGNTERDGAGSIRPAFPKARYLVQRREWEDANRPHERNAASYLDENFAALEDAGALELQQGDFTIEPGLTVLNTGGHTLGHQAVLVESEGQGALYLGDLVPTRAHIPLPYVMAYDLHPVETLKCKRRLFAQALERDWLLLFDHDKSRRWARLSFENGRYAERA